MSYMIDPPQPPDCTYSRNIVIAKMREYSPDKEQYDAMIEEAKHMGVDVFEKEYNIAFRIAPRYVQTWDSQVNVNLVTWALA